MSQYCRHNLIYYGPLDIIHKKVFIAVIDSWRCTRCGMVRVGKRTIGTISSTEGIYPDPPDPSYKWLFFICFMKEPPEYELYPVKPGHEINHKCGEEGPFKVMEDFSIKDREGMVPAKHVAYLYESIFKGYIDISTIPPKVVTVRDVRKV